MNLDHAVAAHAEWKIKLRTAIETGDTLDAASIQADNCCELGRWLHGDAKRLLGTRPAYQESLQRHAEFHREAGRVAEVINRRQADQARAMLESGGAYAAASSAVGLALTRLKREMAQA
ncbi:MAG: CZB domain-containing protein [Phenylobacterium sp.]|uniref:CZB domain-containing protein n=1 Tax=Phenylobacterium sp. TaxID=1871053 RepID=UPI002732EEE6|nr:CZB domain-containing protein [Phenylobacterium sp.]MDP1640560.1 CZB domain-containing protein [Phenylobacterium sp.]MDP3117415.1 CZB domain-containing protein [Phenylobacterium sp.]MDP3385438.1 CZB domain-containing protein [Phenylobacterium sp.]